MGLLSCESRVLIQMQPPNRAVFSTLFAQPWPPNAESNLQPDDQNLLCTSTELQQLTYQYFNSLQCPSSDNPNEGLLDDDDHPDDDNHPDDMKTATEGTVD